MRLHDRRARPSHLHVPVPGIALIQDNEIIAEFGRYDADVFLVEDDDESVEDEDEPLEDEDQDEDEPLEEEDESVEDED